MRFKLVTQANLNGVKIDWTTPVEVTDEIRDALAPNDPDAMQAGALLRGVAVGSVTYPRGSRVFRVAEGHEHFVELPASAIPARPPAAPVVDASWSVERAGTIDRYRGTLGTREQGHRLDVIVAASIPELSRAKVQRLIEDGHVRVVGQTAVKSNLKMRSGDVVEVDLELSVVN